MDPTKPATTFFDANRYRLFTRFVVSDKDGIHLETRAWNRAVELGELVGECRQCGYKLRPQPTEVVRGIAWYVARCVNINCEHEVAAPNGLLARRSSRHNEQPKSGV